MPTVPSNDQNRYPDALAVVESRIGYSIIGAAAGLAGVVWLLGHDAVPASRAAVMVGAGPLFGGLAGFDFYATREWSGRVALLLRLELSCGLAATLTALCGVLVGATTLRELTEITQGGFGVGLFVWLSVVLRALRDEAVQTGWRRRKK